MKQKTLTQSGFTIIELLVVLSIMTLLMSTMVINFNQTRASRSVILAQNESVTNLRKVQSYMLSSKNITTNVPAKFYYIQLHKSQKTYNIGGIDNSYNLYPQLETVTLPGDVYISNLALSNNNVKGGSQCVEVIFAAPFGKMYLNDDSNCSADLVTLVKDPTSLYALTDQTLQVTFHSSIGSSTKDVSLYSLTGRIDAN